jgi:hypothetical protein
MAVVAQSADKAGMDEKTARKYITCRSTASRYYFAGSG